MKKVTYTQLERDLILRTLTKAQRDVIDAHLKRGKKDTFDTSLAKGKGENSEDTGDNSEWELLDIIDAGEVSPDLKCDCGRSLRFQYVVVNKQTGIINRFGKTHFQIHTGIPPQIVADILRGFGKIDYDLDELLYKVKNGWDIHIVERSKELKITIPDDIQVFLDVELPLLEKQLDILVELNMEELRRLAMEKHLKERKEKEKRLKESQAKAKKEKEAQRKIKKILQKQLSSISSSNPYALDESLQGHTLELLNEYQTTSALVLCENLNSFIHPYHGHYLTGKPLIYPYLINYLEELVSQGKCKFVSGDKVDRIYTTDL